MEEWMTLYLAGWSLSVVSLSQSVILGLCLCFSFKRGFARVHSFVNFIRLMRNKQKQFIFGF